MKKLHKKLHLLTLVLVAGLLFFSTTLPAKAYIQKEGTVSEAVTLKQNADDTSKQVMELAAGQEVKVNNEITDNSGMKWYQVFVNGNTMGYVPADTVKVSSGSGSGSTSTGNTTATQTQTQTVTITERVGKVTAQSAIRVREKASTASEQIASMEANDTFLVLADENASDGHVWYKVEFDDHGKTVYGYVRSDLVSVEEVTREEQVQVEVPVTDVPEENTESPYSIISQKDAEGKINWYLLDATNGDAAEISSLLSGSASSGKAKGGLYKVLMILFLLLFIAAAGGATFFYMRWQEAEEFIDELRERQQKGRKPQKPAQPASKPVGQPMPRPISKPIAKTAPTSAGIPGMKPLPKPVGAAPKTAGQPVPRPISQPLPKPTYEPVRQPVYEPAEEPAYEAVAPNTADIVTATQRELQNSQNTVKANPTSNWKSKNFLTDDEDDLDFDFLDMDDK